MGLKEQIEGGVTAAGVYDALSARLADEVGFDSLYLSGYGLEATQLGAPDMGLMTLTEVVHQVSRITAVTDVPLICDIDTGFGGVNNIWRTVRELERVGAAAMQLEDQTSPKRCPVLAGKQILGRSEAIGRIEAAVDARRSEETLIIGRTDSDTLSFDEMITRSNLYLGAGADVAMPMMLEVDGAPLKSLDPDEQMGYWAKLAGSIDGPVACVDPPLHHTANDMIEAGFKLVIFPVIGLEASITALRQVYGRALGAGTTEDYFSEHPREIEAGRALMDFLRLDDYINRENRFVRAER